METFTDPRAFVANRRYSTQRREALARLDQRKIDEPMVELITAFNSLPCCFTLQCCYGHFISAPDQDDHSLEPIPRRDCGSVRYRIAYVALCLEHTADGKALHDSLGRAAASDPDDVQFGSADWFWEQHLNSYALQVEPARYMRLDEAVLHHAEALRVQERRDLLFKELAELLQGMQDRSLTG